MPRLFTALEVPAEVAFDLSLVRGGLPGARWLDAANFHLTLRFYGDIDDRTANEVDDHLARIDRAPVEVAIDGLDVFGGDRPRSIFARVQPIPALVELQAEVERAARRAGLPPEAHRFTPHITLARLRGVPSRAVAQWLGLRGGGPSLRFIADRIVMFSSRASTGGGPYIPEVTYPLDGVEDRFVQMRAAGGR